MGKKLTQLIPECHKALDDMKYEIASELGIKVHQGSEDYWGHVTSHDAGSCGGLMTKRLVALAQQALAGTAGPT